MSHISLKMCARRAVRVTSVFSSAAASLRVRTDRDVCRAENCVRNTSGNRGTSIMYKDFIQFYFIFHLLDFFYVLRNPQNTLTIKSTQIYITPLSLYAHLTLCCHRHGWLLPSGCIWRGYWRPSLSHPLSSAAPVSPSSSPSSSGGTLGASAQSS